MKNKSVKLSLDFLTNDAKELCALQVPTEELEENQEIVDRYAGEVIAYIEDLERRVP